MTWPTRYRHRQAIRNVYRPLMQEVMYTYANMVALGGGYAKPSWLHWYRKNRRGELLAQYKAKRALRGN